MKKICLFVFALIGASAFSQADASYDKSLAQKLGADEYGMKKYVLVMLKSGPNTAIDKNAAAELFNGHMANINLLASQKKLIVAGPLAKNDKSYRGIFILDAKTIEEAKAMVAEDPAVREKLLEAEFYEWYGGAALPEYLEAQQKITLKKH